MHCSRLYGPEMRVVGSMSHDGLDCSCEFQCSLPQYETQRILEDASRRRSAGRSSVASRRRKCRERRGRRVASNLLARTARETVRPSIVIGAGGAHSVTRHSMSEPLEGTTYRGNFLVADIAMPAPVPAHRGGRHLRSERSAVARASSGRPLDQLSGPGRRHRSRLGERSDRAGRTAPRQEISADRRLVACSVSDASADRLAPGRRATVLDRRRRAPFESVRRRRTQRGPARRPRPGLEVGARAARPMRAGRCSTVI